jgi:hypothetical protein
MRDELAKIPMPVVAITSLAIGADQLLARLVIEHGGEIHAVLPFADIERSFSKANLPAYRQLAKHASLEVLETQGTDQDAYLAAGLRVVDQSDILFAVWDGKPAKGKGGTADIVAYASQRAVPLIYIDPLSRTVRKSWIKTRNELDYRSFFEVKRVTEETKAEKALEHALDIRKFEIGLYWQRAAYFWALIAVAFAGYFAILSAEYLCDKEYLAYIVSCIGFLFTWAWFLVNRGSKYWQENWENHVDMLEDEITGPLYKTVLHRPPQKVSLEKFLINPMAVSVSKVNQWVSCFVLCVWIALVIHALPKLTLTYRWSAKHTVIAVTTLLFACLMYFKGRTNTQHPPRVMSRREARIQ